MNGLVGGFGIYNNGTEVQAGFDVDNFWIGRTNADKKKPFIISNGVVYIDESAIQKLTFSKLRDESGSFIVEGGKVKATYLDADNLNVRGQVNVGAFTGWGWPAAGQGGAHLSAAGFLIGNPTGGGKYLHITSGHGTGGNAAIYTNIPAHLEDAQVSTLKLAGASVTVPSYVSGGNNIWINNYNISSNETATYSVFLLCSMVCGDPADLQCRLYGGGHNGTLIINELPGEAQLATRGIVIQLQSNTNYSFNWYDARAGAYVGGGSMFILATKR